MTEDESIHHLDRRRLVRENRGRRLERLEQIRELNGQHRLRLRQRHECDLRFQDNRERPLGSDHQLRHVERPIVADELVQVVTAHPAEHLRIAALDLIGTRTRRAAHLAVAHRLERVAGRRRLQLARVERPEPRERPVGQDDVLFEDVIDGLPVEHGTGTGGVVGHHAAHGGAAGGGDIGREPHPVRLEGRVQLVEDDAGLDARPALGDVDLEQPVEILRRIDDQAAADGLPGLRGAAASQRHGTAMPPADLHGADEIVARRDDHDAERLDLVDAGIGRVQAARNRVETHLALELSREFPAQRFDFRSS